MKVKNNKEQKINKREPPLPERTERKREKENVKKCQMYREGK